MIYLLLLYCIYLLGFKYAGIGLYLINVVINFYYCYFLQQYFFQVIHGTYPQEISCCHCISGKNIYATLYL